MTFKCVNIFRLFRLFGAVFGFVASDVMQKVVILQDHRQGEQGSNYETLQTMVQYEVENNLVVGKKKPSGCSALLPLHRALEFICDFLIRLHDSDNSCRFSTEAVAAYDATIAKYHPWIVRQVVHVALYAALPRRQQLLIKMKVDDSAETMEQITCLIHSCRLVFDTTQELFTKHDLLGIPVA